MTFSYCSSFVFAGGLLLLVILFAMLFVIMIVISFFMISYMTLFFFYMVSYMMLFLVAFCCSFLIVCDFAVKFACA